MDPFLTIAICCHNSSQRVSGAIRSLLLQRPDPQCCEIVMIDNASQDSEALKELVAGLTLGEANLRLVKEDNLGLSHARNRAVGEARGEYILFLDDDIVAAPDLVQAYLASLSEFKPDVFGGNVLPLFEQMPPAYMGYEFWTGWSLKHFGSVLRWLDNDEYFIGANIGARRSFLLAHPFDDRLGRKGKELIGGEEWFLRNPDLRRLFVPQAYVLHNVPAKRMTVQYLAERRRGYLQARYRKAKRSHVCASFLKGLLRDLMHFAACIRFRAKLLLAALTCPEK